MWSNTSAKNIKKLQAVQNLACKIIMNAGKYNHVTPALRQLGWLPVRDVLVYRDTVVAYKCTNNLAPPYLCDRFVKHTEVHQRASRNRGMLQIPHSRTSTGQRSFLYKGVKIWNELDRALKHIPSLRVFKSKLREGMVEGFLCGASV